MEKTNFSLIELIVVIAMGAMVLTVGISAAHATAAQGKNLTCKDSLRNIGQAVKLYAADNVNYVPCRVNKNNVVADFGNGLYVWGPKLIWGGYFGSKPTVPVKKYQTAIAQEKMKYFVCPEDKSNYLKKDVCGSYFIYSIGPKAAVAGRHYGEEEFARILIGRDRAENAICFDAFPYGRGKIGLSFKANHGKSANVLRLGGEVDSVEDISRARGISNFWHFIGEMIDGIEL